ncbi:MAG: SsrA-binding protein [Flavobacteriaceae bacterium]|nr:SsrA-binding protein [Flavobacteriaceae bacterium]
MKKQIFKVLANLNRIILPSMAKRHVDMSKAKKWQMAIIGWRYFITKNSLD